MIPRLPRLRFRRAAALALAAFVAIHPPSRAEALDEFAVSADALLSAGQHPLLRTGNFARDRETLRQTYERRQYRPIWIQNRELTREGVLLLQTLRNADEHGLRPEDYDGTQLTYNVIDFITNRSATAAQHAELDVGLSIAAARIVRHLHFGRIDPWAGGFALNKPRAPFDVGATIERLATGGDEFAQTLGGVEPTFLHYQLIKRALLRYRLLAIERELTELPAFKARSIKPGENYEGIPQLRRLLVALGDVPEDAVTSDEALDDALADGIRRFQRRHGLTIDGALGRKTFAALTTPLAARAEQLAFTLERWRWLPELDAPPIVVNIPQFRLFAFERGNSHLKVALETDVIVGKTFPKLRTPAFTADLTYVVFRPYWEVPTSILQDELLPEIRKDARYLDKNNLEIVSATDANAPPVAPSPESIELLAAGALRLRQRPGEDNSLGLVKLMLPNPHNVYLHSTPAQRLFEQARRTFSHGCIRVSNIVGLVEYVLRNEGGEWTRERIEAAMRDESPAGHNRHVFLGKSIPVLVIYGTAVASEDGEVRFFEDIYEHDAKLRKLLR